MRGLFALQVKITLLLVLGLAAYFSINTPVAQSAITTALLIPETIPDAPVRPLLALTKQPVAEQVTYPYDGGEAGATLFLPADNGKYGAVVLFLGINADMENPHLKRVSEALARSGIVALVPTPVELLDGKVSYREIDALVGAYRFLEGHPQVDAKKIGMFGFSVGASLVLVTAADSRISERVKFVTAFGGYYSAESLFIAMTTRQIEVDGKNQPWEPDGNARFWFAQQMINKVPDEHSRSLLEPAARTDQPLGILEIATLSLEGKGVYAALFNRDPGLASVIYQAIPSNFRQEFARLSPSMVVDGLKTNVYLMHDRGDSYIPFTESRKLAAALAGYPRMKYEEFDLFQHVEPTRALSPIDMAREVGKLFGLMNQIVGDAK